MTTQDVGAMKGKNYALNFPLRDGISDENYRSVFEPVFTKFFVRIFESNKGDRSYGK